jgi:hypothetical protein
MGNSKDLYTDNEQSFGELLQRIKEKRGFHNEKDSNPIEQSGENAQNSQSTPKKPQPKPSKV